MILFSHVYIGTTEDECEEYSCNISNSKNTVGYCKYIKLDNYTNRVYIEYIHIYQQYRRIGYATDMVKELQNKYNLTWNYKFSDVGRLWFNMLVNKNVVNS